MIWREAALALLVALAAGSTLASAQTQWDMATPYSDGSFHTKNIRQFTGDVEKATNGALKINVHPNNSLVKHADIKNAVRRGIAPMGEVLISLHANESPVYGIDSVPFLAASYDAARKLYTAQRPFLEKRLAEEGLVLLYSVPWPPQGLYARKEINTVEDLRGLKFRTYNVATQRIAALSGAVPVQVELSDVSTAFATGRVEAMMTSAPGGTDTKVWEFVTHYYDTQAWIPRNVVIVNKAAFDRLPQDQKQALRDAAKAAEERGWRESMAENESKRQMLADNKMIVQKPSPELMKGLEAIGAQITAEFVKNAGPDGQAILDAYKK
ncbi:MAG: TRAP transporter substrate-binding protein [Pseudomonadota bacterium]|nr:TRAP transporter substrate-binding protein [Pseudomonadota bacterium]